MEKACLKAEGRGMMHFPDKVKEDSSTPVYETVNWKKEQEKSKLSTR